MRSLAIVLLFLIASCGEPDKLYQVQDASVTDLGVDREVCRFVDEEWGLVCCVLPDDGLICWRPK